MVSLFFKTAFLTPLKSTQQTPTRKAHIHRDQSVKIGSHFLGALDDLCFLRSVRRLSVA